jgi:hypothetical protein
MDDDDWPDNGDDFGRDDVEIDVCQHCGRSFEWTSRLREAWQKHWKPGPDERQPQRCFRCITDDTWCEPG